MFSIVRNTCFSVRGRGWVFLLLLLSFCLSAGAKPSCRVTRYDENNGLSQWRVTQMLQDYHGVIWFATWNGLNRFDGYEFKCFKVSQRGDCMKTDDRIRNIWLSDNGDIYCKSDEGYYRFDTETCTFHDIPDESDEALYKKLLAKYRGFWIDNLANGDLHHTDGNGTEWVLTHGGLLYYRDGETGQLVHHPLEVPMQDLRFGYSDRQGNLWIIFTGGVYKFTFTDNSIEYLPQEHDTHVRCIFPDRERRYWVTGRDDATVRLYDAENRLLGYLGADGRLHREATPFIAPVYCIMQSRSGDFWMGSKPGGLFRLQEERAGEWRITRYVHQDADPYSLSHDHVYDIKEDDRHRLWIATLGGGVNCMENPESDRPRFIHKDNELKGYPQKLCRKVRYLHLTDDGMLLAATTEGLLVSRPEESGAYGRMVFKHHVKQPKQPTSLSCSALMDILQDSYGHLFISTENGGINQLVSSDLLADTLRFKHFDATNLLPSDVVLTMAEHHGSMWVVCVNQICVLNPYEEIVSTFDETFFQRRFRFSEARPTLLPDGRWLFGFHNGAFSLSTDRLQKSSYVPPLILTGYTVQDRPRVEMTAFRDDTLTLHPGERNLTVHFAAVDYTDAERISYSFRLLHEGELNAKWNPIGKSRSATFLDLAPGEYILEINSTNADGIWVENARALTLIVVPTFWETGWAVALWVLIALAVLAAVAYTLLYIRRIRRQQHETLVAYLALVDSHKAEAATETSATVKRPLAEPASEASADATGEPTPSVPSCEGEGPAPVRPAKVSPEDEAFMQRVVAFVEAHIADPDINIGDMAAAAAASRSGLNRKMKSMLGITPLDFLREARIKRACRLLDEGQLNVSEVAYRCGFSDPKYFSRCFKASVGVSPTEYKSGKE